MRKQLIVVLLLMLAGCTFQSGSTRDYASGWDEGILWYHAYLKNDHSTAYCFDDSVMRETFEYAKRNGKEVVVEYETYLFRGALCSANKNYETVVVTKVWIIA